MYTANGIASLKLPSGRYKIYAGRGFEYGIDSVTVFIKPGEGVRKNLKIRKEVQTNGWVSSDTHIHTLSHSGHGDATDQERAISIAGEGIELPIITEHNLISDLSVLAEQLGLSKYFTVVPGDEVTTTVGHFNYFPLKTTDEVPDYKVKNWNALQIILQAKANKIIVLNHARDIHNGFRPFDPKRHISVAGRDRDNWSLPANAMEVVNSGALLSNRMQLFLDWFGMLNRGIQLSPVGASDSHDVARYLVGQARTYIKANDEKQGSIEIDEVISNLRKGKVMVSFGLLPHIKVNQQSGPGDLAPASSEYKVEIEVLGPSWITAGNVSLYSNGKRIHQSIIRNKNAGGIKWTGNWALNKLKQDVFLVVIAEGEQKSQPFWPIVKPFQPTTTEWTPYVIGCSGVVWIDADGDGKPTAAYEYAKRLVEKYGNDLNALIRQVNEFDEAVAVQTASLLNENGINLKGVHFKTAMKAANASTIEGVRKTIEAIDLLDKK